MPKPPRKTRSRFPANGRVAWATLRVGETRVHVRRRALEPALRGLDPSAAKYEAIGVNGERAFGDTPDEACDRLLDLLDGEDAP